MARLMNWLAASPSGKRQLQPGKDAVMKIRHPLLIKSAGFAGAWLMRWWLGSLRCKYHFVAQDVSPYRHDLTEHYIYAVWHENLLLPVYQYARSDMWILISHHADGQILSELGRHIRMKLIRGSTSRGGVQAMRKLIRRGRQSHIALAADGPRGPRRQVQPGLVYLAARSGMVIVPSGVGYERPWRLRSWDRFALPRPWTRAICVAGTPIRVPPDTGRRDVEIYRRLVETELVRVNAMAERWAETGKASALRDPALPHRHSGKIPKLAG
jgi:lysophospholipid acyltransferase (LPLAT)-like uncharacterized protein